MIVVSYEVFDRREKLEQKNTGYNTFGVLILENEPTPGDVFCYMTCCFGLFTGEFYFLANHAVPSC